MANWRTLAKKLALADGKIDDREYQIIHDEILADHKINRDEAEFLIDLRREAKSVSPSFDIFVHKVIKKIILADGTISDHEADWLRKWLVAQGRITPIDKALLNDLKNEAKSMSKGFIALYDECMKH